MKTFKSGSVELLHMDCMEYMCGLPDKAFDLRLLTRLIAGTVETLSQAG
jgi:hypothetical protein